MDPLVQSSKHLFRWLIGDGEPLGRRAQLVIGALGVLFLVVALVGLGASRGSGGTPTVYAGGGTAAGPSLGSVTPAAGAAPGLTRSPSPSASGTGSAFVTGRSVPLVRPLLPGTTTTVPTSTGSRASTPAFSGSRPLPVTAASSSAPGTIAPASAPASTAPTGIRAVRGTGWVQVSWTAPPHPDSVLQAFNVYVGTTPGGEASTPANGAKLVFGTTYTVTALPVSAAYYVTVQSFGGGGLSAPSAEVETPVASPPSSPTALDGPAVAMASTISGSGYWLVDAAGDVSAHGSAVSYGPTTPLDPTAPVVGIAATPGGLGYWEVTADGQVYAFGDAVSFGSVQGLSATDPVVGMAPTGDGKGYWLVAVNGEVIAFGDAPSLGSLVEQGTPAPVVGIALDRATGGYWLVDNVGAVFGFDAPNLGSMAGQVLNGPVVGVAGTADGLGYWLVADDGGVFSFGDAVYSGSAEAASSAGATGTPLVGSGADPVVALSTDLASGGYWLVASDGDVVGYDAPVLAST